MTPQAKQLWKKYVPGMFKLLIGLSAVWAVLMIVLVVFNIFLPMLFLKRKRGRKRIENAVYGLVWL